MCDIFHENGYPEGVVEKVIRSVVRQGDDSVPRVMQNDDGPVVFMRLPWIGTVSNRFCRETEHTIRKTCPLVKPVVCFTTRYAFSAIYKDRLPATCQSLVIYRYKCVVINSTSVRRPRC